MPELPEIEVTCRAIVPLMIRRVILNTRVYNVNLRYLLSDKIISLTNEYVIDVQRRAKFLLFQLYTGWIVGHFGISGYLKVLRYQQNPTKHCHLDFVMDNGYIIRYVDIRKFGFWIWKDDSYVKSLSASLGIEPFDKEFSGSWLFEKSRNRHRLIKLWLMDSKVIAGIGNIYANESLFISGILPDRLASSLSKQEAFLLVKNIKQVLSDSIRCGGTTIRNFFQPDGKSGLFVEKIQVYGRKNKPCLICGNLIEFKILGGRSTFFCLQCQS
ncbi:bifunctional DNA-formamidopyrimidine glycosylase/DNA-(apurinic or apyrimidinic site) lyase [Blochmannia endosymbiont of Colobopsis nipponica]|uniref:bifunctional DNA-formamidopyrimidine glycosylase/DNA-(apurinic or apyrimidinic site) lyase n=1 Tax=Blochmannia endosymbiont of Colobopsis nipponica TaxID=2681987 RepID=UPI001783E902|nr:bifunctional DNA-formamidopyrimidine glycosylase/DNA-(apurinic or apyrimidinic site) lyase [Blochmannia endosymbiont of Colobopsis nipponica]QOI11335.1 bifunctional DNA-formamidopyrimidine glycosylase/DNA-(apurinic or apyrimidinic site) lyase [Blochmannia endosymbiont of Colobopsis nipponica]